jgi:hypothetical protein
MYPKNLRHRSLLPEEARMGKPPDTVHRENKVEERDHEGVHCTVYTVLLCTPSPFHIASLFSLWSIQMRFSHLIYMHIYLKLNSIAHCTVYSVGRIHTQYTLIYCAIDVNVQYCMRSLYKYIDI